MIISLEHQPNPMISIKQLQMIMCCKTSTIKKQIHDIAYFLLQNIQLYCFS